MLVVQDIGAVLLMSISRGEAPSLWALTLVVVVPALAWATKYWSRLGHGEMEVLFGLGMAVIPGYLLFTAVGLSGRSPPARARIFFSVSVKVGRGMGESF